MSRRKREGSSNDPAPAPGLDQANLAIVYPSPEDDPGLPPPKDAAGLLQRESSGASNPFNPSKRPLFLLIEALQMPPFVGVVGWDLLTQKIVKLKPCSILHEDAASSFYPKPWDDRDDIEVAAWFQNHAKVPVSVSVAADAVNAVSRKNAFHPVRDYLEKASEGWDGEKRLDGWLTRYCGADDSPLIRAIGTRWMVSAVARIFEPGCQADHVLLLEGRQGLMKSSVLKVLGDPWFNDGIHHFDSKDTAITMASSWIVEMAELCSLKRSDNESAKSFITRRVEIFRPPYGRRNIEVPRQCVLAGTTNSAQYLKDLTGNRRFWPVKCREVKNGTLDYDGVEKYKDQLWGEAVREYYAGKNNAPFGDRSVRKGTVRWYIWEPELLEELETEHYLRTEKEDWVVELREWLYEQPPKWMTIKDLYERFKPLNLVSPDDMATKRKVLEVLGVLGWEHKQRRTKPGESGHGTTSDGRVYGVVPPVVWPPKHARNPRGPDLGEEQNYEGNKT